MSQFKVKKLPKEPTVANITPEESNKRTKKRLRIIIGAILLICSLAFIVELVARSIGQIHISTNEVVFTPIVFRSATGQIAQDESTTNILIAGIGGQGHDGALLTDSLMLARIDHKSKNITLLSIPRDLFIAYPGGKSGGRINSLYGMTIGDKKGINLLAEKVSEVTGQPIHHYMVIDFTGFRYIVDALGGIDIDVPKDLVDREYPTDNWTYTTFIVHHGVQTFDGETALKYARSRHSTSDFDRSERQQVLIKAIKDKALSLDFLTSPSKIQDVLTAIRSHLDTDLTVSDIIDFGKLFQAVGDEGINVYNLSNACMGLNCSAGAYLYNPSREYFDGASVLIPENASATKLSYYTEINHFADFIFRFPQVPKQKIPLVIVYNRSNGEKARLLAISLKKMGLLFDTENLFVEATGAIESSHITVYKNDTIKLGWREDTPVIAALKYLEEKIPYIFMDKNEYMITDGPKIEIVLGKESDTYFQFARPSYYMPLYQSASGEIRTLSGSSSGTIIVSGEAPKRSSEKIKTKKTSGTPQKSETGYSVSPGEWENF